jgi:hypothetical protein
MPKKRELTFGIQENDKHYYFTLVQDGNKIRLYRDATLLGRKILQLAKDKEISPDSGSILLKKLDSAVYKLMN